MQRRSLLALLPALLLTATVDTGAAAAEPVKFAVTDIEGLETLQREFGPFRDLLSELTEVKIELFAVNSRTVAAEALRNEQVDFVLTGPAEYVVMHKLTNAEPVVAFSRPDYFSAIIVMADSRFQRPEDLTGQRVAFGDIGSTSNHLAPAQILADYGVTDIEPFHTSTDIAHEALKNGDVAALGVNYRTWLQLRDRDPDLPPGAFRAMLRSGDLPNDLLMVGPHVDPDTTKAFETAFEQHSDRLIEAILAGGEENLKYEGMQFVASVEDRDYDYVRSMYATIGFPEYAEFVGD
jgi:phosphonate transport system substrate-binding protein